MQNRVDNRGHVVSVERTPARKQLVQHVIDGTDTYLQAAFQSTDRVEVGDDELFLELAPRSSPHKTEVIRVLCDQTNDLSTNFPGTNLRLRLAVQPHEPITK